MQTNISEITSLVSRRRNYTNTLQIAQFIATSIRFVFVASNQIVNYGKGRQFFQVSTANIFTKKWIDNVILVWLFARFQIWNTASFIRLSIFLTKFSTWKKSRSNHPQRRLPIYCILLSLPNKFSYTKT